MFLLQEYFAMWRLLHIFVAQYSVIIMEATLTTITRRKRISRTARWARAHKWCIEVLDPELQAQCKSYKDGKKIIRSNEADA